ncbi:MAG: sulfur carrier protein ThiS [Gracilibacteraceae bacterium]|jgi:thiamine biosynthesis protein ThiS|nr:sulfur carrier protein ThiS [Gracilibacteraceae bacterium]
MRVNGQQRELKEPVTLAEYLRTEGYTPERVAVEWNGAVVPRTNYGTVRLRDGDTLEIVHFVGGG